MKIIHLTPFSTVLAVSLLMTGGAALADNFCVMTCPADMTVASLPGGVAIPINYTVTSSSTCGGYFQAAGLLPGSEFSVGTTTSVFTAVDPPNQQCQFSVTVTATPAAPTVPTSIPTLSEWGMIVLTSLLALGGVLSLRRMRL